MIKEKEITAILISVDQIEFNKNLHVIKNRLIPIVNKIKVEFNKIGLGPLDNPFLNDILFGSFSLIKEKLSEQINLEAPSRFLKGDAVATANRMLSKLNDACEDLTNSYELASFKNYLSIDAAGNVVISNEAIQELKEYHSTYCTTENGQELMTLHQAVAKALNAFYQLAKADISQDTANFVELFDFDEKGNVIPNELDYDRFQKV